MGAVMPTLEEREAETPEQLAQRLDAKKAELGITHSFAHYIEQMENYLLRLERRVKALEEHCKIK